MDKKTEIIRKRYDRNAFIYDLFESPMEMMGTKKLRKEIVRKVCGRSLEVGVGTGKNIPFYPEGFEIVAVDFSPKMLARAKERAKVTGKKVVLELMDIQHLDFPDESFDTVFATCVFCSVPDPVQGFRELWRVLKKDGRLYLLEHMRSERPVLGWCMDVLNPLAVKLTGANINRRTLENLQKAGFRIINVRNVTGDIVKMIEAEPVK